MMRSILGLWLLATLVAATPARAADPPRAAYPALGAPEDPKVPVRWNRFHDLAGLTKMLQDIHRAHPTLTRLHKVGSSYEGRDIYALEVTHFGSGDAERKPAMYIDGNIHGNEVQAGETVLYTAWYLTEMYGRIPRITQLLNDKAFYLIPSINPDGRDHWFHDAANPHLSRGGRIPVDNDGDGQYDEDGPEDLDGDGSITQMRVRDPWGRWRLDPDHPEYLMQEAERDARGEYTRLGWEGIDNDGDGQVNEDGPGGYDPNRNWPWTWQPESIQYGARDYPFSLPETRAISEFVLARPNIAAAQSYHNAGGMILRGPGQESGETNREDESLALFIAKKGEEMIPGYDALVVWKDLYTVWGGEFEWFYGGLGMISFTNELWTSDNMYRREPASGDEGGLERAKFLKYLLQDQGLTAWHEVEHPDFGTVEVGGTSKNFGRVPPSFLLEEELHRNMAFTLYHAESMPLVRVGEIETRSVARGLTRVRVPVENHGIIPTRIGHDVTRGITPKNSVTLTGPGLKVVAGGVVQNPLRDSVAWQDVRPGRVLLETVPGLSRVMVEFLVEGSGSGTVRVDAVRGGRVTRAVRIR